MSSISRSPSEKAPCKQDIDGGRRVNALFIRGMRLVFLAILLVILVGGCAPRDDSAREERQGGFYGGVLGGHSIPRSSGSDM
jgi:hypothetical protein